MTNKLFIFIFYFDFLLIKIVCLFIVLFISSQVEKLQFIMKQNKLISSISTQKISQYQQKIRKAIQLRYEKSKCKKYKYSQDNKYHYQKQRVSTQKNQINQTSSSQSSLKSVQMQQLNDVLFLKNAQFININQFHKKNYRNSYNHLEINVKSRKLRINYFRSKDKSQRNMNSFKELRIADQNYKIEQIQKQPIKFDINSDYSALEQNFHKFDKQIKITNIPNFQKNICHQIQQQRKFNNRRRQLQNEQLQINFYKNRIQSSRQILKSKQADQRKRKFNKYLNSQISLTPKVHQTKSILQNQKGKLKNLTSKNNNRRFLQKLKNQDTNHKKFNTITNDGYRSQFSQQKNQIQNQQKKNPQNKLKIQSTRRLQTQPTENYIKVKNQSQDSDILVFNRPTKNNSKLKRNLLLQQNQLLMQNLKQTSEKKLRSLSQDKWKLQQISFRFRPIQQQSQIKLQLLQKNNPFNLESLSSRQKHKLGKGYQQFLDQKSCNEEKKWIGMKKTFKKNKVTYIKPKNSQTEQQKTQIKLNTTARNQYKYIIKNDKEGIRNHRRHLRIKTQKDENQTSSVMNLNNESAQRRHVYQEEQNARLMNQKIEVNQQLYKKYMQKEDMLNQRLADKISRKRREEKQRKQRGKRFNTID